jgi:hypothetical protein
VPSALWYSDFSEEGLTLTSKTAGLLKARRGSVNVSLVRETATPKGSAAHWHQLRASKNVRDELKMSSDSELKLRFGANCGCSLNSPFKCDLVH